MEDLLLTNIISEGKGNGNRKKMFHDLNIYFNHDNYANVYGDTVP